MIYDTKTVVWLAAISLLTFWLFSRAGWAEKHRSHAEEAVKIYSISTAIFLILFVGLVSSGFISKESGSAIPSKNGPRSVVETQVPASIFDEKISSWCDNSVKQIVGEGFLDFFEMESQLKEGFTFALGMLLIIIISKILNGLIVIFMFGFKTRKKNSNNVNNDFYMRKLIEAKIIIDQKIKAGTIMPDDFNVVENIITDMKNAVLDPWKYLYIAVEKIILIFASISSAAFPVAYYYGWIQYSLLFSSCFPIIITSLSLPFAISVSIGTSLLDVKMRNSRLTSWLTH